VFTTATGTPLELRNLTRTFKALLKDHGLPAIRVHDLRHSCLLVQPRLAGAAGRRREQDGRDLGEFLTFGVSVSVSTANLLPQIENNFKISKGKRGEPGGNRTHNPQIKSLLLCQLSYRPPGRGCRRSGKTNSTRAPSAIYNRRRSRP
jgi:hypothetical protein